MKWVKPASTEGADAQNGIAYLRSVVDGTATGNYLNDPDPGSRKAEGQAGKDMIWGTIAADQLYGGDGDDWIMGNLDVNDVNFTAAEDQLILSQLPSMRDWFVQAGAGGMAAADTLNRGDFMLGGAQDDTLTGGDKADPLVGNEVEWRLAA